MTLNQEVEIMLRDLGFLIEKKLPKTGEYRRSRISAALSAFQIANNLDATGCIDSITLNLMQNKVGQL